jgi:hypothetical protein
MLLRTIVHGLAQWDALLVHGNGLVPLSLTAFRA